MSTVRVRVRVLFIFNRNSNGNGNPKRSRRRRRRGKNGNVNNGKNDIVNVDQQVLNQLMMMGYDRNTAIKALKQAAISTLNQALDYLNSQ